MELPIGMLIFKAQRFSDSEASITGIWYFKEMYVPQTKEEKILSIEDLKRKRCTVLTLKGTFDQVCEIIMRSDAYQDGNEREIDAYAEILNHLIDSIESPVVFDEIFAIKGTSLSLDITVSVEDTMPEIMEKLMHGNRLIL